MYAFVREVTGSRAGAALAGLAWGVMPFRVAHLLHLQLQSLYFLPLAFLYLHRVMAGRRRRDAVLLGVCAALQAISSVYWGVIGAVGLAVAAVGLAVGVGRWRSGIIARRLALAGLVGAVLVAPFAWPYWQVQQREGFSRNLYEASQHEASLVSYLRVPPGERPVRPHRAAARAAPAAGAPARREGPEQELFPGFVLALLALGGAWVGWRRDSRPTVIAMAAVRAHRLGAVARSRRRLVRCTRSCTASSSASRRSGRPGVSASWWSFGLAVLAALALRAIAARRGGGRCPCVGGAAGPADRSSPGSSTVSVPLPTVAAPQTRTAVGRWLAQVTGPRRGALPPARRRLREHRRRWCSRSSTAGRSSTATAASGPSFFMGLVDSLNQVPAAEALWTLRDLGVRFIVSPRPLPRIDGGPLVERATLAGQSIYELAWTAEAEAARAETRPAGAARARAAAVCRRGDADLPGGVAHQRGDGHVGRHRDVHRRAHAGAGCRGGGARARHFAVDVRTASWVARFFEAHDRIETWTDDRLIPIRQEQHLREGRRVVDRATRFDAGLADAGGWGGPAAAVAARRARRRQRVLLRADAAAGAGLLDRVHGRRGRAPVHGGPERWTASSGSVAGATGRGVPRRAAPAASGGGGRASRPRSGSGRRAARAAAARGRDGLRFVPHRAAQRIVALICVLYSRHWLCRPVPAGILFERAKRDRYRGAVQGLRTRRVRARRHHPACRAGRVRLPDGRERRGQDHAAADPAAPGTADRRARRRGRPRPRTRSARARCRPTAARSGSCSRTSS